MRFQQFAIHAPFVLALFMFYSPIAQAQTVCVQCSEPEATYLCQPLTDSSLPLPAAEFFCVSQVAKQKEHKVCSLQRGRKDCEGELVSYAYDGGIGNDAPVHFNDGDEEKTPKQTEPSTLGEFTKRTIDSSSRAAKKAGENIGNVASGASQATTDAIKDAGKAIGDATKKTLKCLGSALNDC